LGALASAGQCALEPLQYSAGSQASVEPRHCVPDGDSLLAGQAALVPVQYSAGSHAPAEPLHWTVEGTKLHVPTLPGRLQASQVPPLQAVSQQTPSTQLPLRHWLEAVHDGPGRDFGTQAPLLLQ